MRDLITAVFQEWRREGRPFLVLRNYERLPEFTSNDIDVLVPATGRPQAEQSLLRAARKQGFELLIRAEFATLSFFLAHPASGAQAHFDLFTGFWWRGFELIDSSGFLARRVDRGLFDVPQPVDEAVNSLTGHLVHAGKAKDKYRALAQSVFRSEPDAARALLASTYGPPLAEWTVSTASRGDWAQLERQVPAMRRALIIRQLTRHPLKTAGSLLRTWARWARRWLRPPGVAVALCGADGCGKSTAMNLLVQEVAGTFTPDKGAHYHWKPPVFSGKRQAARAPVTNPHDAAPRPFMVSLAFFGFHWVEFFLGSFLRLQPRKFRGGMVLIDRYYYDFFVDQTRYRLKVPMALVRLGYLLLPKPDLVFALDAPTAVLRQRKQEVPEAETERQRQAYADLIRSLPNGRVIDATQPPEEVAASLRRELFAYLKRRADGGSR